MLYAIATVLFVLWVVGVLTATTAGGLLHLLLLVAVIVVTFQLFAGRRPGRNRS